MFGKNAKAVSTNLDPSISNILQSVRSAVPAEWVWRAAATKALLTLVVPRGPRHRHVPGNAWYVRSELNPPWVTRGKNYDLSKGGWPIWLYRMRWHNRYNINAFIQVSRIIFWMKYTCMEELWTSVALCHVVANATPSAISKLSKRLLSIIWVNRVPCFVWNQWYIIWECSNEPLSIGIGVFGHAWKYAKYLRSLRNCCRCSSCAFPNRALLDVMVLLSGMAENTLTFHS